MTVTAKVFLCLAACLVVSTSGCAEHEQEGIKAADGVSISYERREGA